MLFLVSNLFEKCTYIGKTNCDTMLYSFINKKKTVGRQALTFKQVVCTFEKSLGV